MVNLKSQFPDVIFIAGPTIAGLAYLCYLLFFPPPHDPRQFSLREEQLFLVLLTALSSHFLGLGGVKLTGKLPLGSDGSFIGFSTRRMVVEVERLLTVVNIQGFL